MSHCRSLLAVVALFAIAISAFGADKKEKKRGLLDSPAACFFTTDERIEFSGLQTEEEAKAFFDKYWAVHGPELHGEVENRIAAADKFFPLGDKKGSQTERGRVFMILGAPNRQRQDRNDSVSPTLSGGGAMNSIEQRAFMVTTWIYKIDRLPRDLAVAELTVTFQVDVNRGLDIIENPGLVEPYLTRAAAAFVKNFKAPVNPVMPPTPTQQKAALAAMLVPPDDAVWAAESALNGAIVTGDSYVSPTDKPFYAIDFYLPKSGFASVADVVVAGVIRDSFGKQVASVRTPAKAVQYDANGDRFVDAAFELPGGHYTGAFALARADGTFLASSKQEFDVMPAEHVCITKVLMTSRIDTLQNQQACDPFTFVAMKYSVKGDRPFLA